MTTYVRAPEAARRLDVTLNTLYAYVSRGRISRTTASDGRTSLFDLDEIERLRDGSRRRAPDPPPSIDVRIATGVTHLDEAGVRYRGHRVVDLIDLPFESIAELLWTGELPGAGFEPWPTVVDRSDHPGTAPTIEGLIRLACDLDRSSITDPIAAGRLLLGSVPAAFGGSPPPNDSFAAALATCWVGQPDGTFVSALNRALILLADHELATSTLAVRVATSTGASPMMAVVAGLATVSGALHGAAAAEAHQLIVRALEAGAATAVEEFAERSARLPGFGHSIYRNVDPRFELLFEGVAVMEHAQPVAEITEQLIGVVARRVAKAPNIDLALAALLVAGRVPADAPVFSIARLAGWIAHHDEERAERPLRFRGLAR